MEKEQITVFYSWQSDIPENRNFIEDALNRAIKELSLKKLQKHRSLSVTYQSLIRRVLKKMEIVQRLILMYLLS